MDHCDIPPAGALEVIVEPDHEDRRLVVVTAYGVESAMQERYLEVMYRKGKPFAAYLYLPRELGVSSVRTEAVGEGLIVNYGPDGNPIGVEITAPSHVLLDALNAVLGRLGQPLLSAQELAPLPAA